MSEPGFKDRLNSNKTLNNISTGLTIGATMAGIFIAKDCNLDMWSTIKVGLFTCLSADCACDAFKGIYHGFTVGFNGTADAKADKKFIAKCGLYSAANTAVSGVSLCLAASPDSWSAATAAPLFKYSFLGGAAAWLGSTFSRGIRALRDRPGNVTVIIRNEAIKNNYTNSRN